MEVRIGKRICGNISGKRILYSICFFMFCVIDQRIRTAYGPSGWLETFRDLTGVVMAIIVLSHYRFSDFRKWKIPHIIWSVVGIVAGTLAFIWGMNNERCLKDWFVILLDVFLFGHIIIRIFIDTVIEKRRLRLNKKFAALWLLMMILMLVSRSNSIWPFCYLIMFGCFYLTGYSRAEQEDLFQGMLNGIILGFFFLQGLAFVFRPYDEVRYRGIHYNSNMNAFFYLEVLTAVLLKLIYVVKRNANKWIKLYYWLGAGVVLSFLFLTVGRTAWIVAFVLVLLFLWALKKIQPGKRIIVKAGVLILCACLTFPVCYGAARYIPPLFHHPVWYGQEWSESKVHSWDSWDSEKYVSLEEFMDFAVGRLLGSIGAVLKHSPFAMHVEAAEAETAYETLIDDSEASMAVRMEIYKYYVSRLNLWGNDKKGDSWGWHAHSIYLQYGTDFGVVVLALFLIINGWSITSLMKNFLKDFNEQYIGYLFFLLVTLLYGILECSWGAGSLGTLMMFLAWGNIIRNVEEADVNNAAVECNGKKQ